MVMSSMDYESRINKNMILTTRLKYSHWDAEQAGENNTIFNPEMYVSWDKLKNNIITAGADLRFNKFTRTSVLEKNQNGIGAFIQNEIELDKLSVLMALRFDHVENITSVITPKFAVMYQALDNLRLRASCGRGFHAPTIQELYEEGYGHGGRAYRFGNPDLQPEYSLTTTFSVEYTPVKNLQVLVHGYYNLINDMITPVYGGIWEENPDTNTVIDKWVRTNIHEAKIFGVETTLRYQVNDKLLLEGGYNYTDNQNITTGGQLPYFPGESFFSKIIYNFNLFPKVSGSGFISLRTAKNRSAWDWKPAVGSDYTNPDGLITELKDYQLINAGIKVRYNNKINLYLNIGNILGQNIQKLDDALTEIEGEPTWKTGCLVNF
jgi:outer membrane receptor protein involved in Fe transport